MCLRLLRKGAPTFKERRNRQRQPNVGNLDSEDSTYSDEEIPQAEGDGAGGQGDEAMDGQGEGQ